MNQDGGLIEQPKRKYTTCLVEKLTGTVIFAIPDTADQKEKEQVLEEQIYGHLIRYSNMFQNYDKAIEEVQKWLRALCNHIPKDKPWIVEVSERAGQRFVVAVGKAKTMHARAKAGEMIIQPKDIRRD